MTTDRLARITTTLTVLCVGMVIGARVSWAMTGIVLTALTLAIVFAVALVRMEEQRDRAERALAAAPRFENLDPWQLAWLDRVMERGPDGQFVFKPGNINTTPRRHR